MEKVFLSPYFINIGIPVIAAGFTLLLRLISKKQGNLERNDYAFGFDLCVTSIILFITTMSREAAKVVDATAIKEELNRLGRESVSTQQLYKLLLEIENANRKFIASWWLFFMLFVLILLLALYVKSRGWRNDQELNLQGLFSPIVIGVGVLLLVSNWSLN